MDLPNPEIKLGSPASQADFLPTELSGKPLSCWTFCAFELDTTSHLGAFASKIPSAQSLLALHSLVSLRSLLRGYMCHEVLPESLKNSFTPYLLSFSNQSESILRIALEQVFLLLDLCEVLGARERGWCDQDGQGEQWRTT